MDRTKYYENYAKAVLTIGVNLQPGEILYTSMPTEFRELAGILTRQAFEMGAKDVVIKWEDPIVEHYRLKYASEETLAEVHQFEKDEVSYYAQQHACKMVPCIFYPDLNSDISLEKLNALSGAQREVRQIQREYINRGEMKWNAFVLGNEAWAEKIYPDLPAEERGDRFFREVAKAVRITEDTDPVENWKEHCRELNHRARWLNEQNFDRLHITTGLGTDVEVGLVKGHIWCGAADLGQDPKRAYCANMPTEEVFTAPDKYRVNGKVAASRPLFVNGRMVEDFWVSFKDGAVSDYDAAKGREALTATIEVSPNSRYIGEIALVPNSSPISQMNQCFYFVPMDENAASHMALGTSFTSCVQGGAAMSEEELEAAGVNQALNHCDFMYGTSDMRVTGIRQDGSKVLVMEQGEFVI